MIISIQYIIVYTQFKSLEYLHYYWKHFYPTVLILNYDYGLTYGSQYALISDIKFESIKTVKNF